MIYMLFYISSSGWGYSNKYHALRKKIIAEVPGAEVTGNTGRSRKITVLYIDRLNKSFNNNFNLKKKIVLYAGCFPLIVYVLPKYFYQTLRGHRGRDRIVVRFTTTCAISADHH